MCMCNMFKTRYEKTGRAQVKFQLDINNPVQTFEARVVEKNEKDLELSPKQFHFWIVHRLVYISELEHDSKIITELLSDRKISIREELRNTKTNEITWSKWRIV